MIWYYQILKKAREEKNFKQLAIAKELGIGLTTFKKIESKFQELSRDSIVEWCNALELEKHEREYILYLFKRQKAFKRLLAYDCKMDASLAWLLSLLLMAHKELDDLQFRANLYSMSRNVIAMKPGIIERWEQATKT